MTKFTDASDVYGTLGQVLSDMVGADGLGGELAGANAAVRFSLTEPDAAIVLRFSTDAPNETVFGDWASSVDVSLQMTATVAHDLFLGKRDFFGAQIREEFVAEGQAPTLMTSWPKI